MLSCRLREIVKTLEEAQQISHRKEGKAKWYYWL
jgi:hypothetical protein